MVLNITDEKTKQGPIISFIKRCTLSLLTGQYDRYIKHCRYTLRPLETNSTCPGQGERRSIHLYYIYISITVQCMQRHVLMIPEDNVSQWTGTAGDNRSPQIIVIPVSSVPPLHSQSPTETFCTILFCKALLDRQYSLLIYLLPI